MHRVRLIDGFVPLIARLQQFRNAPTQAVDVLATQLDADITAARHPLQDAGYAYEDIEQALFAVVAWADELLVGLDWPGAVAWQQRLLQRRYFQISNAGNAFYERLDRLTPMQNEVRNVYFTCLCLGFAGRYGYDRKQKALHDIRQLHYRYLMQGRKDDNIFPDAYQHGPAARHVMPRTRWPWRIWSALLLPSMLLGLIFFLVIWQQVGAILIQTTL